jgi:hypothetical protein
MASRESPRRVIPPLTAWWNVVTWDIVAERYAAAMRASQRNPNRISRPAVLRNPDDAHVASTR